MSSTIEALVESTIATTDLLEELTPDKAKELTSQLRNSLHDTSKLYINAWRHQVWKTLGYTSWEEYINGEFGDLRVALPKEQRSATVIEMAEAGMPTRAIATTTGISKSSVNREIQKAQQENKLPDELAVTGEDGKVRISKKKPAKMALDEDVLNMSVADFGIEHYSSTQQKKAPAPKVATPPAEIPVTQELGLDIVENLASEFEEAIRASILANDLEKFDAGTVPLHLVTTTSRSLLAAAGLLHLFNLQPTLTEDNSEIIQALESSVNTLDAVLEGLRTDEK